MVVALLGSKEITILLLIPYCNVRITNSTCIHVHGKCTCIIVISTCSYVCEIPLNSWILSLMYSLDRRWVYRDMAPLSYQYLIIYLLSLYVSINN